MVEHILKTPHVYLLVMLFQLKHETKKFIITKELEKSILRNTYPSGEHATQNARKSVRTFHDGRI